MSHQHERRREPRVRINQPTWLVLRDGDEPVQMVDASLRGLFVRTERAATVGHLMRLAIDLPNGKIVVWAVVVRIVDDGQSQGIGLRFFALHGAEEKAWASFMAEKVRAPLARTG